MSNETIFFTVMSLALAAAIYVCIETVRSFNSMENYHE